MREYQLKRHATEPLAEGEWPDRTLCGEMVPPKERCALRIDNANPDCKRCLRVIAARPESRG